MKPATFKVGSRSVQGFVAPTSRQPEDMLPTVRELAAEGITCFMGTGRLVAIAGLDPLDIVEVAQVGTHNQAPSSWKAVRKLVAQLAARAPFDVTYADEAGLIATFRQPLSRATARALAQDFLDCGEGLELMLGEAAEQAESLVPADDDDMSVDEEEASYDLEVLLPLYLQRRGGFHLWWD